MVRHEGEAVSLQDSADGTLENRYRGAGGAGDIDLAYGFLIAQPDGGGEDAGDLLEFPGDLILGLAYRVSLRIGGRTHIRYWRANGWWPAGRRG